MEIPDRYNQHPDFYEMIEYRLGNAYSVLDPIKDTCYFIEVNLDSNFKRFWERDDIVDQIIDAISMGKTNIFFDCPGEAVEEALVMPAQRAVDVVKSKYPNVKFCYISGSANAEQAYINLCRNLNIEPNMIMIPCHYFESVTCNYPIYRTTYEPGLRDKNFVCFNRVIRPHRIELLDRMLEQGLVNDKCYYSFHDSSAIDGGLYAVPENNLYPNINNNLNLVKSLRLNFDNDRTNPVDIRINDLEFYDNSYFSLITETIFYDGYLYRKNNEGHVANEKCVFYSEKIYKPIAMLHPFLLVSSANSLSVLRERGFKTFHPYIDETYDTIENDNDRMSAIISEVKRLSSQTPKEWLRWTEKVKHIVEHNFYRLHNNNNCFMPEDLIERLNSI